MGTLLPERSMTNLLMDLYLWMRSPANDSLPELTSITKLTNEALNNEINITLTRRRDLVCMESNKFAPEKAKVANTKGSPQALNDLKACDEFMELLQRFKKALEENSAFTVEKIYDLVFLCLESSKFNHPWKVGKAQTLFANFLSINAEAALDWYQAHQAFAKTLASGISFLVRAYQEEQQIKDTVACVAARKIEILSLLELEKNVAGILPLFEKEVSDVVQYAALLLAALDKDTRIEQIIHSGLLNRFVAFHFPHASRENNEIEQLVNILKMFPEAKALVDIVKELFENYLQFPQSYQKRAGFFFPTLIERNLTNLACLFNEHFLMAVCLHVVKSKDLRVKQWLKSYLNSRKPANLAAFVSFVGKNQEIEVLKLLTTSEFISTSTWQKLLPQHKDALFYLVAYHPAILAALSDAKNLESYLNTLKNNNQDIHESMAQLAELLKNIKKGNSQAKSLLLSEILNLILANPSLADDNSLVRLIACEAESQADLIKTRMLELYEDFEKELDELVLREEYSAVEDLWLKQNKLFVLFKKLGCNSDFPSNKYSLYTYLVRKLANQADFQAGEFLDALLPKEEQTENVSSKERALIEIIAAVDNALIRQAIVSLLEETPRKNYLWARHAYGEDSVLSLAADNRNLGLIQFLLSANNGEIYSANDPLVKSALKNAARQGSLPLVKFLCLNSFSKPNSEAVDEALDNALANQNWSIVQFFCGLDTDNKPSAEAIKKALITAAKKGNLASVKLLCELTANNQPDSVAVRRALEKSARLGKFAIVKFLCVPPTSKKLDAAAIEAAVINAMQSQAMSMEMVEFLCNLPLENTSQSPGFGNALYFAVMEKKLPMIKFLCSSSLNNPLDNSAIVGALKCAVLIGDEEAVDFLCEVAATKKIDLSLTMDELLLSSDIKLKNVAFLCSLTMKGKLQPSKMALCFLGYTFKKENPALMAILNNTIRVKELRDGVAQLKCHGEYLQAHQADQAGDYAISQANKLLNLTNQFVNLWSKDPSDPLLHPLRAKFKCILQDSYQNMSTHRQLWKPILANIVIAATGIGLLVLLSKYLVSGTGFFAQTARQVKLAHISNVLNKINTTYREPLLDLTTNEIIPPSPVLATDTVISSAPLPQRAYFYPESILDGATNEIIFSP